MISRKTFASPLFLMLVLMATTPFAAPIRFGAVVPGAGFVTKPLISVRELRYEYVIEQKEDFSCGAAALATILHFAYGLNLGEEDVVTQMLKIADPDIVQKLGFSLLDLKRYVESLGLRGRGYKVSTETLKEIKVPSIVLLDYRGYKHFVVLRRVTSTSVYLGDPAVGNRVLDLQEFADSWNGVVFAVIGQGYDRNNVLVRPREPLTVRNINTFRPLSDTELLDFGFIGSGFF